MVTLFNLSVKYRSEEELDEVINLVDQFPSMSLSEAKAVVNGAESDKTALATQMLIQSKLFPTENEAESHFQTLLIWERKRQECEKRLQERQTQASNFQNDAEKEVFELEIKSIQEMISACRGKISVLNRITAFTKNLTLISIQSVLNLSRCLDDHNPMVREYAQTACKVIQIYDDMVFEVLEHTGANMDRTDLLRYCVGSKAKAHLFAHYGFYPKISSTDNAVKSYVFQHSSAFVPRRYFDDDDVPVQFSFELNEKAPYDLEDRMRKVLAENGVISLPLRCITESGEGK